MPQVACLTPCLSPLGGCLRLKAETASINQAKAPFIVIAL